MSTKTLRNQVRMEASSWQAPPDPAARAKPASNSAAVQLAAVGSASAPTENAPPMISKESGSLAPDMVNGPDLFKRVKVDLDEFGRLVRLS